MGNGDNEHLQRQLYLLLISFGTAALVLALYHIIKVSWYDRYYRAGSIPRPNFLSHRDHTLESMENSVADLIPAHKFKKGMGIIGEDGVCSVCLCDFEEGEELRTLPECLHSFHVQCIDMWFFSHSTCPVCRTDAMSSTNLSTRLSEDGFVSLDSVGGPRVQPQYLSNIHLQTV